MSAIIFIPIILSVKYSMFDWGGVGTGTFIGLENYKKYVYGYEVFTFG